MTKWKNKSPEEKQAIHDAQMTQLKNRKQEKSNVCSNYKAIATDFDKKLNDHEAFNKVFQNQELPIFCPTDGWVACHKYRVHNKEMLGSKILTISGNCKICNRDISKAIVNDEMYIMMLVACKNSLVSQGRIIDER